MPRTTREDLDRLAAMLGRLTGTDDMAVEYAYGRPRLFRDGGAREVSPRLSAGDLAEWLRAAITGAELALAADAERAPWAPTDRGMAGILADMAAEHGDYRTHGYRVERYTGTGGGYMLADPDGGQLMIGGEGGIARRKDSAVLEAYRRIASDARSAAILAADAGR